MSLLSALSEVLDSQENCRRWIIRVSAFLDARNS